MEEITTEQKLQLVQQIRDQYNKNRYDMSNREQILYGRTSGMPAPISYGNVHHEQAFSAENYVSIDTTETNTTASESLKFRCAVAAMLFVFAVVFDLLGVMPLGLKMEQLFTYIAADYQDYVTEYVETLTNNMIP
uniref:hypothetical protein n=1 Tax=Acetatifactor sp. TaxID=1872090 RepID=UPI0040576159